MTQGARIENNKIFSKLITKLNLQPDMTYIASLPAQRHEVDRNVPLTHVVDALVDYKVEDRRDTAALTGLLVSLGEILKKDSHATAAIYRMRPQAGGSRSIDTDGGIENFQQGPTRTAKGSISYPGDAYFKAADRLSLQLHNLDLRVGKSGPIIVRGAPLIAFHVPAKLAKDWLIQLQSGQ